VVAFRVMRRHAAALPAILALAALGARAQSPKTHRLEATPSTVAYGYYWSEAKPALRIASGDIIDVDTLLTNSPTGLQRAGVADGKIQGSLKAIVAEVTGDRRGPGGHILTGPVLVEGAQPGDALEVKILAIDFAIDYGYNGCAGFLPENCDRSVGQRIIPIDAKAMTAEFAPGIVIPLHPFFGSMGVAPAPELGRVSSNPPGKHAGNLDNKELGVGSTLFIPVFVPGALFEVGDGHGAQGDGEVSGTAIECPVERAQLTFELSELELGSPIARVDGAWVAFGFDEDLDLAAEQCMATMLDLMERELDVDRNHALALASVVVDLAVTQIVNGAKGVHAVLRDDAIR
jgi:acetamidase/formamidase